jgi:hypothetical protein
MTFFKNKALIALTALVIVLAVLFVVSSGSVSNSFHYKNF